MTDDGTSDGDASLVTRIPFRRVLSVLGFVVLLVVVLPFVIYAVPQVVGAEHSYIVLSGSMEPAISPGDVVVVDQTPAEEIQKGDIITFAGDGDERPTTHRVIEVVQQDDGVAFRTMGDNNDAADRELVAPQQIQGKIPSVAGYMFVIPFVGHVIRFVGTSLGFALLVIIPITLLITSEIYSMIRSANAGGEGSAGESGETEDSDSAPQTAVQTNGTQPTAYDSGPTTHADSAALSGSFEGDSRSTSDSKRIIVETSEPANATEDSSGVTFTAAELELGIVVLAAFLAYSGWIAYDSMTTLSFTVAGSVGAAFLLLSMLYLAGRLGGGTSDSPSGTATESEPVVLETDAVREQVETARTHAEILRAETSDLPGAIDPVETRGTELTADGRGPARPREGEKQ